MLSNDKLANYSNVQASVEKLTDEKIKVMAIEALRELSDEELQKINDHSDILDKILRGIECFNKKRICGFPYNDSLIGSTIISFSLGSYDKIININPNILELFISYGYVTNLAHPSAFSFLNDDKLHCLAKNEAFFEALLKVGHINNFLEISARDDIISNEGFKECINNQDLVLVGCLISKIDQLTLLNHLMRSSNRDDMIDYLYSLEQQNGLYCDKETLDLILLNLSIIKQVICSDVDDSITKTLQSDSCKKIETSFKQMEKDIWQKTKKSVFLIEYPDLNKPEKKYYPPRVELDSLQSLCIATVMKHRGISAELCQAQVAQAIPNVQSLT